MTNLAKNAMLVSATIVNGGLLGERRDATATELVETTYFIAPRRAKTSKWLIDRKHKSVKAVVAASQRIRETLWRYTVPWGDAKSGLRLLTVQAHGDLVPKLEKAIEELKEAWEEYLHVYPSLIAQSERDLGDLFDRSQYPSPEQAKKLFQVKVNYWPFPESDHFVAQIAKDAAKEAREEIEREIEERLLHGSRDLIRRATETVETLVEKLSAYRVDVAYNSDGTTKMSVQGIFRDSLVENVRDVGGLIEKLNLTNNPEINQIATKMLRLANYSAQHLREDAVARSKIVAEGRTLLSKLQRMDAVDCEVNAILADASDYYEV